MASNDTRSLPPGLLNLNTSLAYLDPPQAAQIEATRFLYVSALSAFLWDLLCTLGQDYRLLTQYPMNLPTLVYFASRISSLAFICAGTVFYAAPVGSCHALTIAIGWCWAVSAPLTSLLFFIRARAVFDGHRLMVAVFGVFWLATLGGSISVPFSISGAHIAQTDRCMNTSFGPLSSAGVIASTCNDTLIFIAISWRVIMCTTLNKKVKSFLFGRDLPYISKALIQGGQQYYFITVAGNVVTMALILTPSTPPLVSAMFVVPSKALENAMACRVFRDMKLGRAISDDPTSGPEHRPPSSGLSAYPLQTFRCSEHRPAREPVVQIQKTVEQFDDRDSLHVVMHDQGKVGAFSRSEDEFV